ncbi:type I glutamate--ammonia ligase [Rhodococcus triatomae]|nr:glutamine synthetase [Rhodococcus triatomae BKS 15-14]
MTTSPPIGSRLVVGSYVDMAGVARAKAMPTSRLDTFVTAGAGVSPSWLVFCVDDHLAFTPSMSVVGDLRLRITTDGVRDIGNGMLWAPADLTHQDGAPSPGCPRHALRRAVSRLGTSGVTARVGHELEFTLFRAPAAAGNADDGRWAAYGLESILRQEKFVADVLVAAERAGLPVDQVHAEYGPNQFELSLGPADPVTAADRTILARTLVCAAARANGMIASFSPQPTVDGAGNGAHLHLSLWRDGSPLFSGGPGPHGLTDAGAGAIAGLISDLPDFPLVLTGSAVSHLRMRPDNWAGVHCCWGLENREAAVRLCADTAGNPAGAHIEVKPVDPAANPYLASAAVLGALSAGITRGLPPPPEVAVNPVDLTPQDRATAGVTLLSTDPPVMLDRFAGSQLAKDVFPALLREAVHRVRSHEWERYRDLPAEQSTSLLRFAWTN